MITDWTQMESQVRGRICFMVRGLDGGGAQRDAILLANELQRRGRPAAIATLEAVGPLRDIIDPAVPLIDLGRGRKLRMAFAFGALQRLMANGRPAAIIASEAAGNVVTVIASRLLGSARRPLIILREVASPIQARDNDPYWQNRLAYRAVRHSYPLADRVLTFTAGAKRDLEQAFGVPARRVTNLGTNAVLTPAMRSHIDGLERSTEPGLIVSVGRLSPEKGYLNLIEAFSTLRRARNVRLIIVGEGTERPKLQALIRERGLERDATLAGHMADPLPIVARADVYACSSEHEGLGNALIEAIACGVRAVSTDAPHGPREILEGGRLGHLVPVGDTDALAAALAQTLDRSVDMNALKLRAQNFTVEAAAIRFIEILDELSGREPRGDVLPEAQVRSHLTVA